MNIQCKVAALQLIEIALEESDSEDLNRLFYSSSSDDEEAIKNLHSALIISKQKKKIEQKTSDSRLYRKSYLRVHSTRI